MGTDIQTGPQPEKRQPSGNLFSGGRSAKQPVRVILHVDMDCFFASIATLGHLSLSGKPLCVAHSNSATVGCLARQLLHVSYLLHVTSADKLHADL